MGTGIDLIFRLENKIWALGNWILLLEMGDKESLVEMGFALSEVVRFSVLLKIPDIQNFMRSSCVPGHCHVKVRIF